MKIVEQLEKLADVFDSKEQLQKELTVFEAGNIWGILRRRYDVIEGTQILRNFALDPEFKMILGAGLKTLEKQVDELEELMKEYGIALPPRPPAASESTLKVEEITDRWIFSVILAGIQDFIFRHVESFLETTSPKLRETFLRFLNDEAEIYDRLSIYGQMKGWLPNPPAYRV